MLFQIVIIIWFRIWIRKKSFHYEPQRCKQLVVPHCSVLGKNTELRRHEAILLKLANVGNPQSPKRMSVIQLDCATKLYGVLVNLMHECFDTLDV